MRTMQLHSAARPQLRERAPQAAPARPKRCSTRCQAEKAEAKAEAAPAAAAPKAENGASQQAPGDKVPTQVVDSLKPTPKPEIEKKEPIPTAPPPPKIKERRAAPLARGGTLAGDKAAGKDAGAATLQALGGAGAAAGPVLQLEDGNFRDFRWQNGRWDLSKFQTGEKMDWPAWNAVIDAEMARRKLLEDSPIPSTNEDPVNFDSAEIPWWAWVRRFHLPEAEKLNGRAAMMGYLFAYLVDSATGAGLVDQQNSFLGKLALHLIVFAILLVRSWEAVPALKNLIDEATFYDKQWDATWKGQERPGAEK